MILLRIKKDWISKDNSCHSEKLKWRIRKLTPTQMNPSITETFIAKNTMKNISEKSLNYCKHTSVNTMKRNLNPTAPTKRPIKKTKTHFPREKHRKLLFNKAIWPFEFYKTIYNFVPFCFKNRQKTEEIY